MEDSQEEDPEAEVVSTSKVSSMEKTKIIILLIFSLIITSCSRIDAELEHDSAFDAVDKNKQETEVYKEVENTIDENTEVNPIENESTASDKTVNRAADIEALIKKYKDIDSNNWGDKIDGIAYKLDTDEKVVALTFDACGGSELANGYDREIIDYLREKQIPALLFVTKPWIEANMEAFNELTKDPLFEIGNHGSEHRPLSVKPRNVYGIDSTSSIRECIEEIMISAEYIESKTNKMPKYFRSGTAYADNVSLEILNDLGMKFIGYDIAGDAGATFNSAEILTEFQRVRPGSIILMHLNRPDGDSFEGLVKGIEYLESIGYKFAKISDYKLIDEY